MSTEIRVRELIAEVLNIEMGELGEDSGLNRHAAWDSLNHVAVIACLEEELGIVFDDAEVVDAVDLKVLLRIVEIKLGDFRC